MASPAHTKILGLDKAGVRILHYLHRKDLREVSLIGIEIASGTPKESGPDQRISLVPIPPAAGLDETGFLLTTLLQQEAIEDLFDEQTSLVLLVGDLTEPFVAGAVSAIIQLAKEKEKKVVLIPTTTLPPEPLKSTSLALCDGLLLNADPAPMSESTLYACANRIEMLLEICQPLAPKISVDFYDLFSMLKKSPYFLVTRGVGRDENRDEQAMQEILEQLQLERYPTLSWKNALIMLTDGSRPATLGEQRRIYRVVEQLFRERSSQLKYIKIGLDTDAHLAEGLKVGLILTALPTPTA